MKGKLKILLFGVFFILILFNFNFNKDNRELDIKVDLLKGLTHVIYQNNKWKIIDKDNKKWYNYNEQKWANAVLLKKNKKVGDYLELDKDVYAMFVYIPRYSYTIGCNDDKCLGYQVDFSSNLSYETPGAIDIKFVNKDVKEKGKGSYTYKNKRIPKNWLTHPAFTIGDKELNGIWVGKFELSGNINNPLILPNKKALVNENLGSLFSASLIYTNDKKYKFEGVSRIIKNSEWSAVNYLTQSIYGKYGNKTFKFEKKEVFKNNSNSFYTGRSAGSIYEKFNSKGTYKYDKDYYGTGASTTGNIYGIYDMSGGAWEYVMANFGYSITGNEGIKEEYLNKYEKYFDIYLEDIFDSDKYIGHSTHEIYNWYGDYAYGPNSDYPWLLRGGRNYFSSNAGIFYALISDGSGYSNYSTRVVLTKN